MAEPKFVRLKNRPAAIVPIGNDTLSNGTISLKKKVKEIYDPSLHIQKKIQYDVVYMRPEFTQIANVDYEQRTDEAEYRKLHYPSFDTKVEEQLKYFQQRLKYEVLSLKVEQSKMKYEKYVKEKGVHFDGVKPLPKIIELDLDRKAIKEEQGDFILNPSMEEYEDPEFIQ